MVFFRVRATVKSFKFDSVIQIVKLCIFIGRQGDLARKDSATNASSELLLGYKALLECLTRKSNNQELTINILSEFPTISPDMFTPLIADAYAGTLLEFHKEEEATEFIYR